MTPHAPTDPQDPATEDIFDIPDEVRRQLDALEPEDREAAHAMITQVALDLCTYALALAHGRLAEAIAEDPPLAIFGDILMGRPPEMVGCMCHQGLELCFDRRRGRVLLLGLRPIEAIAGTC